MEIVGHRFTCGVRDFSTFHFQDDGQMQSVFGERSGGRPAATGLAVKRRPSREIASFSCQWLKNRGD